MRRPAIAAGLAASTALALTLAAAPTAATAVPSPVCITDCTAVIDAVGTTTFAVPAGIAHLSAVVSGAAGSPAPAAITGDPTAKGGAGGSARVDLNPLYTNGSVYAGRTLTVGVGGVGGAAWVADGDMVISVAGGGGAGGYAGQLDQPGQIVATYPGGDGGASGVTGGVGAGGSGAALSGAPANGAGAALNPGAGGTGTAPGTAGTGMTVPIAAGTGGAGGSLTIGATTHTGGAGGAGYSGGGGGAVERGIDDGGVTVDLVAPGGGGSGLLQYGFAGSVLPVNPGPASVTFTWSYAPTVTTGSSSVAPGATVTANVAGLPANAPFSVLFAGSTVAQGTADAYGAATVTFVAPATPSGGAGALQLSVDGTAVASTGLTVAAASTGTGATTTTAGSSGATAELAATGSSASLWGTALAVGSLLAGAGALAVARRRALRGGRRV